MHRTPRTPVTLILLLLSLTLAACAPTTITPHGPTVDQVVNEVHYYPRTAGITRQYQAQNQHVTIRIDELGPTTRQGQVLHVTRTYGGGENTSHYRIHNSRGVFTAFEDTASHTITYDPPLHQYPTMLKVGDTWGGSTTATLRFNSSEVTEQITIDYAFTVLEERTVRINNMDLNVFVINLEATHNGRFITQEHWFTPYLGVVRTHNAQFLTASSLPAPRKVN